MNIAETRVEMMACVAHLQEQLATEAEASRKDDLIECARHEVQRLRKRFKHRIDEKAAKRGRWGFWGKDREGIEQKLAHCTATALAAIDEVAAGRRFTLAQFTKAKQDQRRQHRRRPRI